MCYAVRGIASGIETKDADGCRVAEGIAHFAGRKDG